MCENRLRENKPIVPGFADFSGLGAVTEAADQIIFLYRDCYNPETSVEEMAECIIVKNRYGDTGTLKLRWDPERVAFSLWED